MLCMNMVVFAQGSLLATLSHNGEISAFYGASALASAVNAAENGDVITLSSGQFNAVNISKLITLRGAGMSINTDSINGHEATIIQGAFTINQADSLEGRIVMEGLYFSGAIAYSGNVKNAQFLKCRFASFKANTNATIVNSSFIHCRFYNGYSQNANSNTYFINSIVCNPTSTNTSSNVEFDNCFVKFDGTWGDGNISSPWAGIVVNAYYKNCIVQVCHYYSPTLSVIPSNCTAYNCLGLGNSDLFKNMSSRNTTNKFASGISSVFKSYAVTANNNYIIDVYNFDLTDSAAATYLGTDGTQVGIYGGNLPYDENPTIPQITKCNVASKSSADGKLSVDIEVKAAEY